MHYKIKRILETQDTEALKLAKENNFSEFGDIKINDIYFTGEIDIEQDGL